MRVQPVILAENKIRYILVDDAGQPVIPVIKYLKHLDNTDKSRNTIKTYCYSLKLYFEFLNEIRKDYREINISDLSNFVGWLRNPYNNSKVLVLNPTKARRTEKTVNLTVTAVTNFYDYLFRTEEIANDIIERLIKQVFAGGRKPYKDFLFHVIRINL